MRSGQRVTLSDFSPSEWDVARYIAEDVAQGGRPPAGAGGLADYCSRLTPPAPRASPASGPATRTAFGPRDWSKREGIAAVEFALVAPIFVALLLGIVVYGGWFWLSHSVQSLAAESARVALGGLNEVEQRSLAEDFVARHAAQTAVLKLELATVIVTHDDEALRVRIDYDIHDYPLMLLAGPLPKPPPDDRSILRGSLGGILTMPVSRRLKGFLGDRRGGIAVIAAVAGGLICAFAAVSVDVGSLVLHARKLQGAADLAAMAAASDLAHAEAAGRSTATANMGQGVMSQVVRGRYEPDKARAPVDRFTASEAEPNAVRVTLRDFAPLCLGRVILGRDTVELRRSATAAAPNQTPRAILSIGSRVAALEGGLANQLLSGLTGSSVSLNLMDYNALAEADVNLLTWFDALAVDAGVEVGDYEALLEHKLDAGRALKVLERVAGGEADSALSKLSHASLGIDLNLARVIGVQAAAERGVAQALDAEVSVRDLVMAVLTSGGDRQIALNLGAQAGLADVPALVAIGERPNRSPWLTVSDRADPVVRTAQARVYLKAKTAQTLSGLAQVELPILVELAAAEARLKQIDCAGGPRVIVEARPGLATAMIARVDDSRLDDFKPGLAPVPATLLSVLGLVKLTASAEVSLADPGFKTLTYSQADISAQRLKSVKSTALTQGLVASLLHRIDVDVHAAGLGLGLGGLVQALGGLLSPVAPALDGILSMILDLVGVRLGEAEVTVHDVTCPAPGGRPALVG